uniref:Lichenase n=1 Tax=Stevia rebaudiana TaxID=55670 RepID=A0A7G9XVI4_STERE|nr:lichenase [Stevia rebaudiana]
MAIQLLFLVLLATSLDITESQSVGVCYGMLGNNLPKSPQVVVLYKSHNIKRMRLYDPFDPDVLPSLRGSNIEVMLGVPNSQLEYVALSRENARAWVKTNVRDYSPGVRFRYIAVGNEVKPSDSKLAPLVHRALTNVHEAIAFHGLKDQIKVSTAIDMTLIVDSSPPSKAAFGVRSYIDPIIGFLVETKAPLLLNIYTYFSYVDNPRDISLEFATFTSPGTVVHDGANNYQNLFDAMLDSAYSALEKAGGASLEIVVSETGWPSAGGVEATVENARKFYRNVIGHVSKGTPKRPGKAIETYLFAMFDENEKEKDKTKPQLENNFGVFNPVTQQQKYQLAF